MRQNANEFTGNKLTSKEGDVDKVSDFLKKGTSKKESFFLLTEEEMLEKNEEVFELEELVIQLKRRNKHLEEKYER